MTLYEILISFETIFNLFPSLNSNTSQNSSLYLSLHSSLSLSCLTLIHQLLSSSETSIYRINGNFPITQSSCLFFMGNRWGNSGNSDRLYFSGLQNHCRWWLHPWNKRHLFLGRKVMSNLDGIFKSRDVTLPTKVHLVKAMVFPVVMYGCESWTVKKAERWRIDAFELWC